MAQCTVSGTIKDSSDTAISGATVRASLAGPVVSGSTLLVPKETSTTTAADGTWSLTLAQSTQQIVTVEYALNSTDSPVAYTYTITVPASSTANFHTLATEA